MPLIHDVHQQFAEYFGNENLKPYFYLLSKRLSDGHICLNVDNLDLSDLPEAYKLPSLETIRNDDLVSTKEEKKPIVFKNNRLYLERYYYYETVILNAIKNFTSRVQSTAPNVEQLREAFDYLHLKGSSSPEEINWQTVAIIQAVVNNFTIITGGPGTGKTTTVAKILSILFRQNKNLKVALAAPTGKAAARMAESLKNSLDKPDELQDQFSSLEPSTIHRLLGYRKDSIHFRRNRENPLDFDVIIVDEASMIDVALFAKLLDAIEPHKKLILLGDKDQLASVEAGSLFGDLCMAQDHLNYLPATLQSVYNELLTSHEFNLLMPYFSETSTHPLFGHVIELRKSYRFSDNEGIGKFSKAVIRNDVPTIKYFFQNKDEKIVIDPFYLTEIFTKFVSKFHSYINEKDIKEALKKLNDARILCALREGDSGVKETNKRIEKYLKEKGWLHMNGGFYENRPVIITKNDYELQLFNGDIGIVRKDESDGKLKLWFEDNEGGLKKVYPGSVNYAETVFAMTVHKSQGSEFKEVLIMLPQSEEIPILTRELLYTAITRAKEKVIIQAPYDVILKSAKTSVVRGSGLAERFQEN